MALTTHDRHTDLTVATHQVPAHPGLTDTVFAQLNREWPRLAADPTSTAQLRRWSVAHPALRGVATLAELPVHVRRHEDPNAVLLAVLVLHQNGAPLAGRVLLQLMLPKLVSITHCARLDPLGHAGPVFGEKAAATVAAFLECAADQPTKAKTIAGALALRTLGKITAPSRAPGRELRSVSLETVEESETWVDGSAQLTGADVELAELLAWATASRTITTAERQLLELVYLEQPDASRADIAAELGITCASLRKRLSRTVGRVRVAVLAETQQQHEPVESALPPHLQTITA